MGWRWGHAETDTYKNGVKKLTIGARLSTCPLLWLPEHCRTLGKSLTFPKDAGGDLPGAGGDADAARLHQTAGGVGSALPGAWNTEGAQKCQASA